MPAKLDGRLPAKKGAVIEVKTHLLGLASYSHTHTDTHAHKPTQCPLRLTGLISSAWPPTPAAAEGCRAQAGARGVLAICMWNANVFSHRGQTGVELEPASANELHIVATLSGSKDAV